PSGTTARASISPRSCPGRAGGASASPESASVCARSAAASTSTRLLARERSCSSPYPWRNDVPVRVLLADDDQVMRKGLKTLLEREGFQVVAEAADGRDAIQKAEASHPDVVVLDLAMPGLNGVDAGREISRSSPRTRAILLTMHKEDPY